MGECYENENVFPIIRRVINEICQAKRAGTFKPPAAEGSSASGMFTMPSFKLDFCKTGRGRGLPAVVG